MARWILVLVYEKGSSQNLIGPSLPLKSTTKKKSFLD
jgi:hypothetical protein